MGAFFYTLEQKRVAKPQIERGDGYLSCHVSPNTTGIPLGTVGSFVKDHRSPFQERWGGWYVTGTHGKARHMGNVGVKDPSRPEALDREAGANVTNRKGLMDTRPYFSRHSDIVELMVLEHETKMHNLFTRSGYEVRAALTLQGEMNKVRYLLFRDEPRLESPVRGT